MGVFFLALLFVMVIPLAEGVLFALLLREVYVRHPLPLGGAIVPEWWKSHKPIALSTESDEVQEPPVEFDEATESSESETGLDVPVAEVSPPIGISHFDDAAKIPDNLPVHDTLNTMTSGTLPDDPLNLDHIIGESATAKNVHAIEDNWDQDDLQELANALPGEKIDISQEIEKDSDVSDPISPSAKEVLGDIDVRVLEQQMKESTESRRQPEKKYIEVPLPSPSVDSAVPQAEMPAVPPAEMTLDIQENESGTVQVSSPFMFNAASQFASDFAEPQTVFPTFSSDLLQESSSTAESMTGDVAQFFFSEESIPMYTRKTRKQPVASRNGA
jgi:hypothetical protein